MIGTVTWQNAAAHVPRRHNYAIRHTLDWYAEGLRQHFGTAPFSTQQAAAIWKIPRKTATVTCARLAGDGKLIAHRQAMYSVKDAGPIKTPVLITLRDQVRHACVVSRMSVVDVFKMHGIAVPRGIEWMCGRTELTEPEYQSLARWAEGKSHGKR